MSKELTRAIELRSAGDSEGALSIILALLELDIENPNLNYQAAWTFDSLGRESEAVKYYEFALAGNLSLTDRREALLGLGSTLRCLERYDESEEIL